MGRPITTRSGGICFAFPNVCITPGAPPTPIPYPSVGQLSDTQGPASDVYAGSSLVVTKDASISSTTGDAAGTGGGVSGSPPTCGGPVKFTGASGTVFADGKAVVRMFDTTDQNNGNARGTVLGGLPTVLVGD